MRKQRLLKPAKHFQRWIDGEHWIECTDALLATILHVSLEARRVRYISCEKFRLKIISRTEVLAKIFSSS